MDENELEVEEIEIKIEPFTEETNDSDAYQEPDSDQDNSKDPDDEDRPLCPVCYRTYKAIKYLKSHIRNKHVKEVPRICMQCFLIFKTKDELNNHNQEKHAVKEINLDCPICGKSCQTKKRLDHHVHSIHRDICPTPCTKCDKVCKGKRGLRLHMKNVHPYEEIIPCPQCNQTFKLESLLKEHIDNFHAMDYLVFKCPCNTLFTSYMLYRKHMNNLHSSNRPRCTVCCRAFKTIYIVKKHLKVCHGLRGMNLNDYITYEIISEPKIKKEPESITCDACLKTFDNRIVFNRHMKTVHPPKEAAEACDICHKTFKSSSYAKIHKIAVHPVDGQLACDECDRTFATKKYLVRHKLTHVEDRVQCQICFKYSKNEQLLKRHLRAVHGTSSCGA